MLIRVDLTRETSILVGNVDVGAWYIRGKTWVQLSALRIYKLFSGLSHPTIFIFI